MHKLDRTTAIEPACLAEYDHDRHTWGHVSGDDKRQIRTSLEQMQGARCAYCEGPACADGHVEHFRRKGRGKSGRHFPELTFEWSNLFLSCGSNEHCGHFKERGAAAYDPDELVKPDEHDPDEYFHFHSSGQVRVREGIAPEKRRMAAETIRVFRLDENALCWERKRALTQYEKKQPYILQTLIECDDAMRQEFIRMEIDATRDDPYCTVIRHYFEKVY